MAEISQLGGQEEEDWGQRESQFISFSKPRVLKPAQNGCFGADKGAASVREETEKESRR